MYFFQTLENLIGNTPMIGIKYRLQNNEGLIYAKCEQRNFTGSIKDRIVLQILKQAFQENKLKQGDSIVEATSGNTGISFAAIGKLLGCNVTIIMPNWLSVERKKIIESFGANVLTVSKEEGGFLRSIAMTEEMEKINPNVFLPKQFANIENVKAHEKAGEEIYQQLKEKHSKIDGFIAGVGTGGTIIGVGKKLREFYPNIKIHPLEPQESPTLTTGYKVGCHRIQGLSDEFIPDIMSYEKTDKVIQIADGDAIIMAQKLAQTLGLGLGISSGANLLGAIKLQQQYGFDSIIATVFPDCNKKYLSTDLMNQEAVKGDYLAPKIELLGLVM
ncbi:MAG: cysteine synthase family protein [Lentimicrobiaceae bacterium]|nr:cysteine synthase family protein [Lentimicrobiaceae bacterium]